jgi:hypothetical protein
MDKVFVFKLINGDEVFGTLGGIDSNGIIQVNDPMSSESRNMNDGSNAMVINRYIPFLKQNSIEVSPVSVVCMGEVSTALTEYYYLSLRYAKTIDEALERNIKTASHFMKETLDGTSTRIEDFKVEIDENEDEDVYKMVLDQLKSNGGSFH